VPPYWHAAAPIRHTGMPHHSDDVSVFFQKIMNKYPAF
jgi:hypothetical protein